jgi:hypothetical protein
MPISDRKSLSCDLTDENSPSHDLKIRTAVLPVKEIFRIHHAGRRAGAGLWWALTNEGEEDFFPPPQMPGSWNK